MNECCVWGLGVLGSGLRVRGEWAKDSLIRSPVRFVLLFGCHLQKVIFRHPVTDMWGIRHPHPPSARCTVRSELAGQASGNTFAVCDPSPLSLHPNINLSGLRVCNLLAGRGGGQFPYLGGGLLTTSRVCTLRKGQSAPRVRSQAASGVWSGFHLLWWCLFVLVRFCHVCFSDTVHYAQRMDEGTSVGWLSANRQGPPPEVGRWPHANPAKHNVSRRTLRSGDLVLQPSPVIRRRLSRRKRTKRCASWRPQSPHLEARTVFTRGLFSTL